MHWFFDYPWGPALTWLVVLAVLAVLGVSFWSIRKEIGSTWGISVIVLRLLALAVVILLLLQPLTKEVTTSVLQSYSGVLIDTSKSMGISDEGKTNTRLDIAREILAANGNGLLAKLKDKGNVRLFQFSTTLEEMPIKGIAGLDSATGDSTAIGSAISQAAERFGADDLTSLVLLTDGQDNAGRSPTDVVRSLSVPLFVVGIGEKSKEQEQDEKDYAIENVVADRRVLINRTTDVAVSVAARGFPNRQVPIELFLGNRLIASTRVALGPKRPKAEGLLAYSALTPGKYTYTVKIPVDKAELDDQNNERQFTVRVIDPVNRVLYLEDAPRWEYKFVNRALNANRNISMLSYVRVTAGTLMIQGVLKAGATAEPPLSESEIDQFKVIVIGDVGRSFFAKGQLERIANFVENGGSVVVLGGKHNYGANGFANTPLARVLPVVPGAGDRYAEVSNAVATTPDGAAHPVFQDIQIDWTLAPELNTLVTSGNMRLGATALLVTADEQSPVVVVHRYGQGKAVVVLTDSTWRWKLGQTRSPLPVDLHQLFWTKLIEWLLPEDTESRTAKAVELITDKDEYELNEQVRLIVTVTDPGGGASKDVAVRCEVKTPDDKNIVLQAQLADISAYSTSMGEGYITSFTPHKSGKYTVTAIGESAGEEIGREEISIIVGDPKLEFRNTDINEQLLKKMAAVSGGKYYRPETAAAIIDDIPWDEKTVEKVEEEEVWNEWWVLIAFITLVTSEWIMRKRRQLA